MGGLFQSQKEKERKNRRKEIDGKIITNQGIYKFVSVNKKTLRLYFESQFPQDEIFLDDTINYLHHIFEVKTYLMYGSNHNSKYLMDIHSYCSEQIDLINSLNDFSEIRKIKVIPMSVLDSFFSNYFTVVCDKVINVNEDLDYDHSTKINKQICITDQFLNQLKQLETIRIFSNRDENGPLIYLVINNLCSKFCNKIKKIIITQVCLDTISEEMYVILADFLIKNVTVKSIVIEAKPRSDFLYNDENEDDEYEESAIGEEGEYNMNVEMEVNEMDVKKTDYKIEINNMNSEKNISEKRKSNNSELQNNVNILNSKENVSNSLVVNDETSKKESANNITKIYEEKKPTDLAFRRSSKDVVLERRVTNRGSTIKSNKIEFGIIQKSSTKIINLEDKIDIKEENNSDEELEIKEPKNTSITPSNKNVINLEKKVSNNKLFSNTKLLSKNSLKLINYPSMGENPVLSNKSQNKIGKDYAFPKMGDLPSQVNEILSEEQYKTEQINMSQSQSKSEKSIEKDDKQENYDSDDSTQKKRKLDDNNDYKSQKTSSNKSSDKSSASRDSSSNISGSKSFRNLATRHSNDENTKNNQYELYDISEDKSLKSQGVKNNQYLFLFYQVLALRNNLRELSLLCYLKYYSLVQIAQIIKNNKFIIKLEVTNVIYSQEDRFNEIDYSYQQYNKTLGIKIKDEIFIFFNYLLELKELHTLKLTKFWFNSDINFLACQTAIALPNLLKLDLSHNQCLISNPNYIKDNYNFAKSNLSHLYLGRTYFNMMRNWEVIINIKELYDLDIGILDFVSYSSLMRFIPQTNLNYLMITLNKSCDIESLDFVFQLFTKIFLCKSLKKVGLINCYSTGKFFDMYKEEIMNLIYLHFTYQLKESKSLGEIRFSKPRNGVEVYLELKDAPYISAKDLEKCYNICYLVKSLFWRKSEAVERKISSNIIKCLYSSNKQIIY